MNNRILCILFAIANALWLPVCAHTVAESNQVLKVMLNRLAHSAGDDVWLQDSKPTNLEGGVLSTRGFFMGGQPEDWSCIECQGVFDAYLHCLATNNVRNLKPQELFLAKLALKHCDTLHYTNAVPYCMMLAANPNGVSRERAIKVAVKYSTVNEATTRFVESVFTNIVFYSDVERETAASVYSSMVQNNDAASGLDAISASSAVQMFYRNRLLDSVSCYSIDSLLCARLSGYVASSNRLVAVDHILSANDIDEETRSHFAAVTNQLLSSGQPLQWINIGGTNE